MTVRERERPGGGERGFTLVELMFSLFVLVVGLLGIASAMGSITRYQDLATARTEMSLLADGKLEQLRAVATTRTADTLQLALGGSLVVPTAPHVDTVQGPLGRIYVRLWQVIAAPGGTREVTLRVQPLVDEVRTPVRLDFTTRILPL